MKRSSLDQRPIIMALAGPNGAGKTTFYHAHLASSGLHYISPDLLSRELDLEAYAAARMADAIRRELLRQRESFIFETVFSDPLGDKLAFMQEAVTQGTTVVLCFIGLDGPALSEERVAMRVSQGGHDVPEEKIVARYPRTMANLGKAIRDLPHAEVYDNSDLHRPFRRIAEFAQGRRRFLARRIPPWFRAVLEAQG